MVSIKTLQRVIKVGFLFFCGIALGGSGFAQSNNKYVLKGKVTNVYGVDIQDAVIHIHETKQVKVTNAKGEFEFANMREGHFHLHCEHIGYANTSLEINLKNDTLLMITLKESMHKLDEVLVESDPLKLDNRENSIYVEKVTEKEILQHASANLMQTLERLPGVSSINTGVSISKPVIRGLSFNRVMVMDNGIKQEGQQWGSDHGLEIDQYGVEGVEILKGPATLIYGSDAMGGVINITKVNSFIEGKYEAGGQAIYRSLNHTLGATGTAKGNRKGKIFKIQLTGLNYGDYAVPADTFRYSNYRLNIIGRKLKNTAGKEAHGQLTLGLNKNWGYTHLTISTYNQIAGLFAGAIGIPRNYTLRDDYNNRNVTVPYQYIRHYKIASNTNIQVLSGWIEIDAGYQLNHRQEHSKPDAHGQFPISPTDLAIALRLHTGSLNIRYHKSIGRKWDGIVGLQGQYQHQDIDGFEFLIPKFKQTKFGIFAVQKYRFSESLTANAGLRFDVQHVDIEQAARPVYNQTNGNFIENRLRNSDINRTFNNVTAALGLSWFLTQEVNIKLNFSRDFRPPTPQELSINGVHHGTFRHEKGDSSLTTEIGWQNDVGLFVELGALHFSVTPFINYFQNYIYLSPSARFSTLPEGGQVYIFSQANAIHHGGEAQVDWKMNNYLQINANVEYVRTHNYVTGLPLPFIPPLAQVTEVEFKTPLNNVKWVKNLSIKWAQAFYAPQNRVDRNEKTTPGYSLSHLYSSVNIGKSNHFQLLFQINNVFDQVYMNHLSRWRYLNLPEAGRNFNFIFKAGF